jgi:putative restriction endonuclease
MRRRGKRVRFWWVNQNQTFRHEVPGGYLWSPKLKANGTRNPFYEFMREVAPGDLIFSFADTRIRAFGLAVSYAYEAPKPVEFGNAGRNWDNIGWRIDVRFQTVATSVRPVEWMQLLQPLLPTRYSPLLTDGRGSQSIYLTELPNPLAFALADLLGSDVSAIARSELISEAMPAAPNAEHVLWEEHIRQSIEADVTLAITEREALVLARRGQGLFRQRVQRVEQHCRITGVDRVEHLRASHCKPWRDSSHEERLDGENGLLLTPSIDHLFDRGFISFKDDGLLLVSPVAHGPSIAKMGVPIEAKVNVGVFTQRQASFLEYHRDLVFLRSNVAR